MRNWIVTSILLLNLCSNFLFLISFSAWAQTEYAIGIRGYRWDHSTLTINIVPQDNQTWWKPSYLNAALHAIDQWNDAIQEFAFNYPEFSYISQVHLVPTLNAENISGFDTYISWVATCEKEETIGLSKFKTKSQCLVKNSTMCLVAKAPSGHIMTEVDMQNIVLHEIGHTLGLSHCNITNDIMYPKIYYSDSVKSLSSLDLYGVSKIFEWMTNSTEHNSSILCLPASVITMASNISYSKFQIASENLPESQNFIDYAIEFVSRPEIIAVILATVTFVVALVITKRGNKMQKKSY